MSSKQKKCSTYFHQTKGLTRKGKTVGDQKFPSLRKAKRYMRTGNGERA